MQLLPVVAGGILPHAPLLLPELSSPEVTDSARRIRSAVDRIEPHDIDALVVVSPHGERTGVYRSCTGSLAPFGVEGIEVDFGPLPVEVTNLDVLEGPIDHGVLVPLRLLEAQVPAVALTFAEREGVTDPNDVLAIENAIIEIPGRVAVAISANLAAGLSPRAPMTERAGADEAEQQLLEMVQTDLGWLSTGATSIADRGESCSLAPLQLMGKLFDGRKARVLAHEAPVGVGYLVAEVV